jgi:hypothetical protein
MRKIPNSDISKLEITALKDGVLQVLPYNVYKQFPQDQISLFCLRHGFYCLPTAELIEFLKVSIRCWHDDTIEIGSGCGVIGRELMITMTDSFIQESPEIKALYLLLGQATVKYGEDVWRMDAIQAVKRIKPEIVIAAWVTQIWKDEDCIEGESEASIYGIDENIILDTVDTYIHIGNKKVHGSKRILKHKHQVIDNVPLISRTGGEDVIYIWKRRN